MYWPAKNPHVSPIEQMWSYIKYQPQGRKFDTADTLFEALETEWAMIRDFVIENFASSFHARVNVCYSIEGESLNAV
jgi:hypothetical protein